MNLELDVSLHQIQQYLQRLIDPYEVYEITRYLCYDNREAEILSIIRTHYLGYQQKIDEYMKIQEDSIFFDMIKAKWAQIKLQVKQNKEVLKYLDIKTPLDQFILDIILGLIGKDVQDRLFRVIIQEINIWRSKQQIDAELPIYFLDLLKQLDSFSLFEQMYLEQTDIFYKSYEYEPNLLSNIRNANYIYKMELNLYLHFNIDVQQAIYQILNKYLFQYIQLDSLDDYYYNLEAMKDITEFSTHTDTLVILKQGMRKFISREVFHFMNLPSHELLNQLILLEEKCDVIINTLFETTDKQDIKVNGVQDAISDHISKFSYSLASVMNPIVQIEKYLGLFKFIPDKELFELYYTRFLIDRLIHHDDQLSKQISDEQQLLLQMQDICSSEWIAQQNLTFDSLNESLLTNNLFKDKLELNKKYKCQTRYQFNIHLIPASSWPYQIEQITLQPQFSLLANAFLKYKQDDTPNMKISFQTQHDRVILSVNLTQCKFDLELSYQQANELLQFNDKPVVQIQNPKQYRSLIIAVEGGYSINMNCKTTKQYEILPQIVEIQRELQGKPSTADYGYIVDAILLRIIKQSKQQQIDNIIQDVIAIVKRDYPKFINLAEFDVVQKQIQELAKKQFIRVRHDQVEYIP